MKNILFLPLLLCLISCKDDEAPSAEPRTPLLTAKTWKLTAATVSPAVFGITDYYAVLQACEKDNLITFNANGTTTNDEGPTKCNTSDPQTTTETWAFANNEKDINFTLQGEQVQATILELNATTFKVEGVYSLLPTNRITLTFTAQ